MKEDEDEEENKDEEEDSLLTSKEPFRMITKSNSLDKKSSYGTTDQRTDGGTNSLI